ncbi:MAG: hypothetical protein AAFX06_12920 [Planctomycetota bacterium]
MKSPKISTRHFFVFAFALLFVPFAVGCGDSGNTVVEQSETEQLTDEDLENYDEEMTQPGGI